MLGHSLHILASINSVTHELTAHRKEFRDFLDPQVLSAGGRTNSMPVSPLSHNFCFGFYSPAKIRAWFLGLFGLVVVVGFWVCLFCGVVPLFVARLVSH